ncbi:hypothetical protein LPJ78_002857 [Coemansia sp. RSA 989]|nr:hypothetical protein LPJ78_002857 [Coemansia sp. RSA 989]
MCKHGHEQMDFIEEEAEGIIEGSTRRHIKSNKRISKRKQERENRLHGEDANFILVQGMQFIIKLQATKLAEIANLPDPFVETVKKLWLLYVSKLDDVNKDMTERDVQNMYLSAHSQDKWAQGSSQESAGDFGQPSQETAVDSGSLDFLMQKVDEDIAKDVEEMRLWEQQDESPVATHNTYMEAPQSNSDNEDMLLENDEHTAQSSTQLNRRLNLSKSDILKHIETFVSLEYLPVILYIALLWLRIPAQLADLHYLMADERVPYASAYQYLPAEITERLGDGLLAVFKRPYPPSLLFKKLDSKYTQVLASAARDLPPEAAAALLPSKITDKHNGAQQDEPRSPLSLEALVEPLYKNPAKVPLDDREKKLLLMSNMAMPLDNHPEISLKRGEFIMSFADGKDVAEGHGYINPIFGMVVARCSMMLGCSQSRLLTEVAHFDTSLKRLFK